MTERQDEILKIIVEEYIRTAEPIGSRAILNSKKSIHLSPATIRNECVALEKNGLIQKLHLSSGRVPSTKGYRYYIENLMDNENIDPLKNKINKLFEQRDLEIDDILNQTGQIISEMTNLTAMVIGSTIKDEKLKKIDLLPLDDKRAVVIITLSSGYVENKIFNFSAISLKDLKISVDIFNKRLENTFIKDIPEKFKLIHPILEKQVKQYEYFLKQFISTISTIQKVKKTTHGIQYMLQNPEFNNSETIKNAIKLIESISSFEYFQKFSIISENGNKNKSILVKIGDEFENKDFSDISVISANYDLDDGHEKSSLALVGPKRVDYNKILNLLNWISTKLNDYTKKEDGDGKIK